MMWTEEAVATLQHAVLLYEETIKTVIHNKYNGTFHAVSGMDVQDVVMKLFKQKG